MRSIRGGAKSETFAQRSKGRLWRAGGIADFAKDLKKGDFKPTPLMFAGQVAKFAADDLSEASKALIKIQHKYLQLHKNNPSHMKGVRLEETRISIPAFGGGGAGTTFYRVYDNYSGKLIANGTW